MNRPARSLLLLGFLSITLCAVSVIRLAVGEPPPMNADGNVDHAMYATFIALRMDRLWIGVIVGAALGVSGAVLQSLLRNPLASPYILGVSSGAALGVMVAWAGWLVWLGGMATHIAALGGAAITLMAVYLLAQKRGLVDPIGLLLVGVIVNAINAAGIMFINYLNPHGLRSEVTKWMMGYIDENVSDPTLAAITGLTLAGVAAAAALGRAMDAATFSDSEAASLGVTLGRLRLTLFAIAGLLTAGSVMLAGPIGFVGLICPHIVRLLAGPAHRTVILGSAITGAIVVVAADAMIKYIAVTEHVGLMPIGIVTALIGGPVFLALLRPQLGRINP